MPRKADNPPSSAASKKPCHAQKNLVDDVKFQFSRFLRNSIVRFPSHFMLWTSRLQSIHETDSKDL